jgi:TonB-linked SusC/RagA family outer membrane protein
VGTTALANRYYFLTGSNTNLPSNQVKDAFLGNTIAPRESQGSGDFASASGMLSFFTRFQYDYDNKYLLSTTLRRDGSSRFGKNNRYGYFPSVSAGWVISREDFWRIESLNFLKLRASWGQNGNDRIGEYSFTTIVYPGQNYTFGSSETITSGSTPLEASNPDLKWETGEQLNAGLDLELFNGKFHFTADYYKKTTRDMLARIPIPTLVGLRAPFQNVGAMSNKGLELSLLLQGKKQALNYTIGANIGFIRSEVLSLGQGGEPIITGNVFSAGNVSRTDVGHPVASFYGYVTDGIFQSQEDVKAHAFQNEKTSAGDIRFKDLNGDGIINEADQTYIGNPTPSFTYGVTSQLQWKGFDVSIFIQGTQGNDIYNGIFRYDFFYSNRPQSALNRWTGKGTSNVEPRVNLNDANKNARVSDRFIEDGSFVRLKNIQLGYDLKHKLLKKWKIDKARIYFSGQNLWTLTAYSGLDPEIGSVGGSLELGIDRGFYPQAKMASIGLQLGF